MALTAARTARFEHKREAMRDAAALLFNEHGVKGTTLADIAAAVGLVTNSVTYYYPRKEALATACFLRSIESFRRLAAIAAQQHGAAERVQAFVVGHARLLAAIECGEHPPLLGFSDIRALPRPQQDQVFDAYTDMFRQVRGLLKDAQTEALLSRDDFNARGHIVLSNTLAVRSWITRHEVDEYPRVARRLTDFILHGMGPLPASEALWPTPALSQAESALRAATPDGAESDGGQVEAFLRAATVLVNEQGYRGASVDKISARLNVTKGSFYHHHDTKHDLIAECFERSFAVLRRALVSAAQAGGCGRSRVCAAAQALVRFQLGEQGPLLRFTATSALPDRSQRERVHQTMLRLTERLGNIVVDGMMDGSVRPLDAAIAAQSITASINAAAELHRWLPSATPDNVAGLYVRPLIEGVLCPPLSSHGDGRLATLT